MDSDVKVALVAGAVVIGACVLIRAIPLLVVGGIVYLLYLATRDKKSCTKENTEECKSGDQKK